MTEADDDALWLSALKRGDERAAEEVFGRYFQELVRYARRKLDCAPRRAMDEEDVALSALASLCRGMSAGRFDEVSDRDDLWKLLITITARKASAQLRREHAEKRGGGRVRGESVFVATRDADAGDQGLGRVAGAGPTPQFAAQVAENCEQLLACLDDDVLRQVAQYKLEGYQSGEIAEKLGCVRETVQRKLKIIRQIWSQDAPE